MPQSSSVIALTFWVDTPLDVHLRQRRHERFLRALAADTAVCTPMPNWALDLMKSILDESGIKMLI